MPETLAFLKSQLLVIKAQHEAARKQAWWDAKIAEESSRHSIRLEAMVSLLKRLIREMSENAPPPIVAKTEELKKFVDGLNLPPGKIEPIKNPLRGTNGKHR